MTKIFSITARGHSNIRANHPTTWQLTKEKDISTRADCIIGVSSSAACIDFPNWLKLELQQGKKISLIIEIGEHQISGIGYGHQDLGLTDTKDIVFRKSRFVCNRTGAINCSFVAKDLPKDMVKLMQDPTTKITAIISTSD